MFKISKKTIKMLLCFVALVCLLYSGSTVLASVIVMDNSGTQVDGEWSGGTPFSENLANEMTQVAENDNFILYYNPASLAIQVVEKATGHVHSSIVEEGDEVEGMNDTWRGMMQSGITLELLDAKGNTKTWSLTTKDAAVEVKEQNNGFTARVSWPEGVGVTMEVVLTETGISVSVPEEGTWEDDDSKYTLQSIYVFPFLDANRGLTQNGYMFVPDGCGALIRTSVETLSGEPYEKQVYGTDMGLGNFNSKFETGMLLDPENIYIPVYGIIQNINESGVAAIIESGDEYANIVAYASGITTDFNFITAKYLVRQIYQMKVSQGGSSIPKIQEERNHFDIKVSYHFLSGESANYAGMAECYREYLVENDVLVQQEAETADIPLKLEFLVSEQESGLVGTNTVVMTSVEDVDAILADLMKEGITNIKVVLRGIGKAGASGVAPTVLNFERTAGTKKEWKALIDKYQELGVDIAYYCDFTRGYDGIRGYSNADKAQSISKVLLQNFEYGFYSYLAPQYTVDALAEFAKDVQSIGVKHLAVDCLGTLYSNWNNKAATTRSESKEILENANVGDVELALYTPNAYMFSISDAVYDIPTSSSSYYIFTDTVPFLQMVLKGYVPMYGTGFNFHANTTEGMLRCIEYGIYPSFYLTKEDAIELVDTYSSWLFTSEYELWKDTIVSEYASMKEALTLVEGEYIVDRVVLAEGVVMVEYSNGMGIVVNYNDTAYSEDGISVEANGYLLIKDRD